MNVFEEIKKRIKPMVCGGMNDPQWIPFRGLIEMLDDVEKEYNNGWIPCSERLPKDREYVLVCATGQDEGVFISYYEEETNRWRYDTEEQPYYVSVVAWQPLPQPYKGE